jgi:hypothetical protein
MNLPLSAVLLMLATPSPQLPPGYWPEAVSQKLLDKSEVTTLAPDLSSLTPREKETVTELLKAGEIFQDLYESSRHHQALAARKQLVELDRKLGGPRATKNLLDVYDLSAGPIATTLENKREAFLPVDPQVPGRNVYPVGITKQEVDTFLAAHPDERDQILGERTVVRRATAENLQRDLRALQEHPAIALFQPALSEKLAALAKVPDEKTLYAVPYSVAYADELTAASRHLQRAADTIEPEDAEFARYLRNRSRDLLTNDYESGDASWVTGHFKRLNAQIGAYETYDDALFGAKAFHSFNVLLRNEPATAALRKAMGGLQEIENALPYEHHKRVRDDIPVGIYEVIADFGQARGGNTATILPNDPLFSQRYGRTIMLRENIMKNPAIFANNQRVFTAAVAKEFAADLRPDGEFQRTLWHEVGHYLGVERDEQGRTLDAALEDYADSVEEMKSDLVSLFAAPLLRKSGYYDDAALRSVYAGGIRRTLQSVRPRADQPYQRMQLLQFNYFLAKGLLEFDPKAKVLRIHYDRYAPTVSSLLQEVLALQYSGDKEATARFFEQYSQWTPELHEVLAAKIRAAQGARFRIFRYAATSS